MFTKNQITLQTFLANGLVPTKSINFATSLANWRKPTQKQLIYIDKLVDEIVNKAAQPPKAAASCDAKHDFSKIFTLFDNARNKLKYPKINLQTDGKRPLRLNSSRKWPDRVYLGSGGFGTDSYGYIERNVGIHFYTKDEAVRADVLNMVKAFAADPEKVSADHGKLTHNCCYCSKQLDTTESLAVGYGPICAAHFGLKWGKNVPRTKPNVKELVETVTASQALDIIRNELLVDGEPEEYYIDENHYWGT
jgi:hypothetical protein